MRTIQFLIESIVPSSASVFLAVDRLAEFNCERFQIVFKLACNRRLFFLAITRFELFISFDFRVDEWEFDRFDSFRKERDLFAARCIGGIGANTYV